MRRFAMMFLVLGMAAMGRAEEPKVTEVVRGNNQFALDLYGRLRERPGNLFLSPHSISTALAMTYAGARGETAEQMAATLHFSLPQDRLHAEFAALDRQINGGAGGRPYQLSVANALWGQEGDRFLPEFTGLLEKNYGAGLRLVDFRSTEQARRLINTWVEEQTKDKIKHLLQPPYPTPDTSLILTNAIYFKGSWTTPFPKSGTRDEDFITGEARKVRIPTMHRVGRLGYLDGGDFAALELPYAGDRLAMVVLLPTAADGLPAFERAVTAEAIGRWLSRLTPRPVDVSLPRFKVEAGFELQDVLSAMGMPAAFGGGADFSGINGRRDLSISAVIHKAFADVNEAGTEAAAATAVAMTRSAVVRPEPPVRFRADHPFLFLIRDKTTGSILFLGRVSHPGG